MNNDELFWFFSSEKYDLSILRKKDFIQFIDMAIYRLILILILVLILGVYSIRMIRFNILIVSNSPKKPQSLIDRYYYCSELAGAANHKAGVTLEPGPLVWR